MPGPSAGMRRRARSPPPPPLSCCSRRLGLCRTALQLSKDCLPRTPVRTAEHPRLTVLGVADQHHPAQRLGVTSFASSEAIQQITSGGSSPERHTAV